MTENHFRMHFSPFQINTQLFVQMCFKMAMPMAMPNMKFIGEFMTQLETPQAF